MSVMEILQELQLEAVAGQAVFLLIVILSLVQVSPLKINPWDHIFGWMGKKMNKATEEKLTSLQKQVRDLWINNHRQGILTFSREEKAGIHHDSEEWSNILNLCEEYERFTEDNHVTNGVVKENTKYIRDLYQKNSHEHKI